MRLLERGRRKKIVSPSLVLGIEPLDK